MYKYVVFDLDGTLFDTLDDLTDAVNYALKTIGEEVRTKEEVRSFIGNGIRKLVERALTNKNHIDKAHQLFINYYMNNCCNKTHLYDGVLEMLEELKNRGIIMCLLTNKKESMAKKICEPYCKFFKVIMGQTEKFPIKPDPKAFEFIIESCGFYKANTLYVGDSSVDILLGENAGVDVCYIKNGFGKETDLINNNPKFTIENIRELINLF